MVKAVENDAGGVNKSNWANGAFVEAMCVPNRACGIGGAVDVELAVSAMALGHRPNRTRAGRGKL